MNVVKISNVHMLKKGQSFNIQSIRVKKLKTRGDDFRKIMEQGNLASNMINSEIEESAPVMKQEVVKSAESIEESIKPIMEEKHEEEAPISFFSGNTKKDYDFDEEALKEKVAVNWKDPVNNEKKEEKKVEVAPKAKITEKEFEKLLSTNVIIMEDKMEKFREVFEEKQSKLSNAKLDQARLADSFQKVSNEQQKAKGEKEQVKRPIEEMKEEKRFSFLNMAPEYDANIVQRIQDCDAALKYLYNAFQDFNKKNIAIIEQCENEKQEINKESEKVRADILKASEDLNRFMENNEPLIKEIIKINENYKDAEAESEKAIGDEYNALAKKRNSEVGINLNIPDENVVPTIEPVQNNIPNINVFENFRRADSQGGNESAAGINDIFTNNYEGQFVGHRRAA